MNLDRIVLAVIMGGLAVLYVAIMITFFEGADPTNELFYLALLGLPLAIGFFAAPRVSLYVLGALVYSLDWLSEFWGLIPREATWLIDVFILLFAARYILTFFTAKHKFFAAEKMVLVALVFAVLSSLINGQNSTTMLLGLRVSFRYLFLFLAAAGLHPDPKGIHRYVRFLFVIGLIQTPVILWQWQFTSWVSEDELNGTFGRNQTPGIALFMLVMYTYLIARMLEEKRVRPLYVAAMFFVLPAPILGEAKIFFLILPVFILFMARKDFFRKPVLALALGLLGIVMVMVTDYIIVQTGFWREGRNPLTYVTRLGEIFEKEIQPTEDGRTERAFRLMSGLQLSARSPQLAIFGNGPGSITHSYVSTNRTRKSDFYASYGLTSTAETFPWMLTEFGYVGTGLFFAILWLIFRRGKVLRLSDDPDVRVYGRLLEGITFLFGAWLFYQNAWQGDPMNFVFWPLAGMLVRLSYDVEAEQAYKSAVERAQALRSSFSPAPAKISQAATAPKAS